MSIEVTYILKKESLIVLEWGLEAHCICFIIIIIIFMLIISIILYNSKKIECPLQKVKCALLLNSANGYCILTHSLIAVPSK